MLFCYNENIITVWEKYLFNNQDSQGYNRRDVVWGGVEAIGVLAGCTY